MAEKKKQIITVLVLCIVLAGFGAGYLLASKHQKQAEEAENETGPVLYELDADQITQLHYSNSYADIVLIKDGDTWKLEEDENFPVDQKTVESMVTDAASVTADRLLLEDCDDLSEYQLDDPTLQLELVDQDGETQSITYGMESAAGGGYYACMDDMQTVYLVPTGLVASFEYTKNQLMELPDIPSLETDDIQSYQIQAKKGNSFLITYLEEKEKYQYRSGRDLDKAAKETVSEDSSEVESLLSSVVLMDLSEGVSYDASKKELKQYGLSDPAYTITLGYTESEDSEDSEETDEETDEGDEDTVFKEFVLRIGALDDLETSYYVQVDGDPGIYLMSADTVLGMLETDAFED
ncbi:MAG: DUF4340 domain-containing protein [Clostridiaceae bacterium]|nr:DUF4340 domain-containing protein [Clostridiaceae bacterium]